MPNILCPKCGFARQANEFRWWDECKKCRQKRRAGEAAEATLKRKQAFARMFTSIRKQDDARLCLQIIREMAIEAWGSVEGMIKEFATHMDDPKLSMTARMHTIQTMIIASAAAEIAMAEQSYNHRRIDVRTLMRRMLDNGDLLPELRLMIAAGDFTLNDLDPPPAADGSRSAYADKRTPVAEAIRKLRVETMGWSQSYFARKVGMMSQPMLARLENGQTKPTVARLQRIAQVCGVSVKELDPTLEDTPLRLKAPAKPFRDDLEPTHTPFWVLEMSPKELAPYRQGTVLARIQRACFNRWMTGHEIAVMCDIPTKKVWDNIYKDKRIISKPCGKGGRKQFMWLGPEIHPEPSSGLMRVRR